MKGYAVTTEQLKLREPYGLKDKGAAAPFFIGYRHLYTLLSGRQTRSATSGYTTPVFHFQSSQRKP